MLEIMKLRIKQLRADRGWTQDELAERAGISRSYLTELETGAKTINARRLSEVARAFGVEPESLIVREPKIVDLTGAVVESARIVPLDGPRTIACPTMLPSAGIEAVEVVGGAMAPVYQHGHVLFYARPTRDPVLEQDIGQPCIVEDSSKNRWLKVLKRGTAPGLWNLVCINPTGENQWDVSISWAARVRLAVPADLVSSI